MANKRHKPGETVTKLRQVDVLVGQGMARIDAIRQVRNVEQTYYRWRILLQQPVADQQLDATAADLDRCDHDHALGAARAEASCTDGGCRYMGHLTICYYVINRGTGPTFG